MGCDCQEYKGEVVTLNDTIFSPYGAINVLIQLAWSRTQTNRQPGHTSVELRKLLIGDREVVAMGNGPSLPGPPGTRFRVIGAGM